MSVPWAGRGLDLNIQHYCQNTGGRSTQPGIKRCHGAAGHEMCIQRGIILEKEAACREERVVDRMHEEEQGRIDVNFDSIALSW